MKPLLSIRASFLLVLLSLAAYFVSPFLFSGSYLWLYQLVCFLLPAGLGIELALPQPRFYLWREKLTAKLLLRILGLSLGVIFLINVGSNLWSLLFPMPKAYLDFLVRLPRPLTPWHQPLIYLQYALVPAVCEEMLFRGFLLNALQANGRPRLGLWASSLAFALAHLNPWQFPFYLLLGLYLGWVQQTKGNVALPIGIHALNNISALLLLHFFGFNL